MDEALRTGAKVMWAILFLITGFVLSGCAVFDPSPYDPTYDPTQPTECGTAQQNTRTISIWSFDSDPHQLLTTTATRLQDLSCKYAIQRNDTMKEELIFDIPILGLGIATVASGIFNGPQDQILALGLAGASVVGTRLYFNPQGKIVAYNSAALALSCAASVAAALSTIPYKVGEDLAGQLSNAIKAATPSGDPKLVAQAQTALIDLNTALATLEAAPVRLQVFANQVIRNTTSKIVTGSQNTDAVLAQIRAATSTSTPKPTTPVKKNLSAAENEEAKANLPELTAEAEAYAQAVKEAWSLSNCPTVT
jgi:hypothetical protein